MDCYCSGEDFHLVRIYSEVKKNSGVSKEIKDLKNREIKASLVKVFIIVLLGFMRMYLDSLGNVIEGWITLAVTILILLIVFSLIKGILTMAREINYLEKIRVNNPKRLNDTVTIYKVEQEGLYLNDYNVLSKDEMTFISWEKVKKIVIEDLEFRRFKLQGEHGKREHNVTGKKILEKELEEVKEKYTDFFYEGELRPEGKLGMRVYFNALYSEYIALPFSWGRDDIEMLLKELGKYTKIENKRGNKDG